MTKLKVGTDFSGVGAFDQALERLGVDYETVFACDMDKYARNTYLLNFGTDADMELLKTPDVKKIDDIYYRGFVNTKLKAPTTEEWKFVEENEERVARLFSFYYPWNVYSRVIPEESVDVSVHTCPCQAFSLAGKRKGEEDRRGILFYNSHEFIQKNRPKTFIFENVKGLLSDDSGKTFARWIDLLAGKTINGQPVLFPHEESVPYHVYFKVLNAKEHGVPQNRERIFIIGIRDDEEDDFEFPEPIVLEKRLKDILEKEVDEKYFLSEKMVNFLINHTEKHKERGNGFNFKIKEPENVANAITSRVYKMGVDDNYVFGEIIQINDPVHSNDRVYSDLGISPTLNTMQGGNRQPFIQLTEEKLINRYKYNDYRESEISSTITSGGTAQSHNLSLVIVQSKTQKRIRRLTELECFRLMDFNDNFKSKVSSTQQYKQAGNSVVVKHFVDLIEKLKLNKK